MQTITENKPWHRHPLVWMMIAIPFSAVVMGVIMMWLALDTDDGLVVDDYYKQGLEINQVLERNEKAKNLAVSAVINIANDHQTINMLFNKGKLAHYPISLKLQLQHATHANSDVTIHLDKGINNQYIGHLKQKINPGVWYLTITDSDWKLTARTQPKTFNNISLQPK